MVPPTEPFALRSTQPLKVSTRDFSWGKGGRCVWLTTYHTCSAETSRKSRVLTYLERLGPPRPVAGDFCFFFMDFSVSDIPWCTNDVPKYLVLKSLNDVSVALVHASPQLCAVGPHRLQYFTRYIVNKISVTQYHKMNRMELFFFKLPT